MMGGQREELPTQIWQNNNEQCCRKWAVFGQTVKPISTMGADYAHHSTTRPPQILRPCDGPAYLLGK